MASISMKTTWAVEFTAQEMRLILKALECRLTDSEKEEASTLASHLNKQKINSARSYLESVDKLERNMEEG